MKKSRLVFLAVLAASALVQSAPAAQSLWQVGRHDYSGRELSGFGDHATLGTSLPLSLHVDVTSQPETAWPFVHPAPIDKWAGETTHAITTTFSGAATTGTCRLIIDAVSAHQAGSVLEIELNGKSQLLKFEGGPGFAALRNEQEKLPQQRAAEFPAHVLKPTDNSLTLRVVDGGWLLYDAIEFTVDEALPFRSLRRAQITPSICFRETSSGLHRVVWLELTNAGDVADAVVSLHTDEVTTSQGRRIPSGDSSVELLLPDIYRATTATVTVAVGEETTRIVARIEPERKWNIHIVPMLHTDIGFTDRQDEVIQRHNSNISDIISMCRDNPALRWNLEVSWQAEKYLEDQPPEAQRPLVELLREGRVEIQGAYLNMLTSLMCDEELNRLALHAKQLAQQHKFSVDSAVITDVPSATWSLPATLAGSGIKYFAQGCNSTRGALLEAGRINTPFYWESPDGSRVLTWLSNHYAQTRWLASVKNLRELHDHLDTSLGYYRGNNFPYDIIMMYGAFGDNARVDKRYGAIVEDWNREYAYPRVQISTCSGFFRQLEDKYKPKLEVRRSDFGAYWEDGAASSARETALNRENQRLAASAQSLWALATLASGTDYPAQQLDDVWKKILLYNEHTWGASWRIWQQDPNNAVDQWNVKASYATDANRELRKLRADAQELMVGSVETTRSGSISVVNPFGFSRGGIVELPPDIATSGSVLVVTDIAGTTVPVQMDRSRTLARIPDVPAFSARTFNITQTSASTAARTEQTTENQMLRLENDHYRIQLDTRRGISSIVEKKTKQQLVDMLSQYGMGQVVYVAGGENTSICRGRWRDPTYPKPVVMMNTVRDGMRPSTGTLLVTRAKLDRVEMESIDPLWQEAVIHSSAPAMPIIATRVRLHNHEPLIELEVQITSKTETLQKEAVYVAFPFHASIPRYEFGMPNAIADPLKDYARGACHEWYCVQNWVSCYDETSGHHVVWSSPDAPLVCLGNINRGLWPSQPNITNGTIFSYAMNNYWFTNYQPSQGGDFRFRYYITSSRGKLSSAARERFAQSNISPLLIANGAAIQTSAPLSVDSEDIIASLKGAETTSGLVLRLRNFSREPATAVVQCNNAARFTDINLVEETRGNGDTTGTVKLMLKPQETKSLLVQRKNLD